MSQGKLTSSLLFAAVPALFAAACVEMEDESDALDLGTEAQELGGCSAWGCNTNSPLIEAWDFHELEETGLPNSQGIRLLGLVQGGNVYDVDVVGARIIGRSSGGDLTGTSLINSYMVVNTPGGLYRIIIKNVSTTVKYWVGSPTLIETYDLVYTKHLAPADPRPLCKNTPSRLDPEGQFWLKPLEAIVFTGDRYKETTMEVTAAGYREAGTWFNIGCAGSALAKLHLTRHTTAGSDSTHQSNGLRRQAMLKMYVADVCGNGFSSTKQGTPLVWENTGGWDTLPNPVAAHEGIWGPNGMLCLETHRLENDPSWGVPGGIQDQIEAACGGSLPQPCTVLFPGFPNVWPSGSYLKTAIP